MRWSRILFEPLGKALLAPEMKEIVVTARTTLPGSSRSATRGVLYVHSAPSALCPHIEWAVGGVLGAPVSPVWTPQRRSVRVLPLRAVLDR